MLEEIIEMDKSLRVGNQLSYQLNAGPKGKRLLVLLHGYGGDQYGISSLGPSIDPEGHYVIVSPRAPINRPGGGASWYDFDEITWCANAPSFNKTLGILDQFIDMICRQYDLNRGDCILGGFSQGAGVPLTAHDSIRVHDLLMPGSTLTRCASKTSAASEWIF